MKLDHRIIARLSENKSHSKDADLFRALDGSMLGRLVATTRIPALLLLATSMIASAAPVGRADDLKTEYGFSRVTIDRRVVRLESLVIRRADAQGRLPIAIFNHGRPGSMIEARDQRLAQPVFTHVLSDFARRGWLAVAVARRGYGLSDGPRQDHPGCKIDSAMAWMNVDADDIQAALEAIGKRPDADPTRMISLGVSAGGGASVALSARNRPGLVAAIDIDGGEHNENCALTEQSIPLDFRTMGTASRVPNLWLFAKNDSLHPPAQVEIMRTAFSAGGGDVKLVEFDPIVSEGHVFSETIGGRRLWLPVMDEFLRAHNLPTWTDRDVDFMLGQLHLSPKAREFIANYLSRPTDKALARSTQREFLADGFAMTMDAARKLALDSCESKAPPCIIAMENEQVVPPH